MEMSESDPTKREALRQAAEEEATHRVDQEPDQAPVEPEHEVDREKILESMFEEFGVSVQIEQQRMAEALPAERDQLERSFTNVRDILRGVMTVYTEQGAPDLLRLKTDALKEEWEVVRPILAESVARSGLTGIDFSDLGIDEAALDRDALQGAGYRLGKLIENRVQRMSETIYREAYDRLEQTGEYHGVRIPPESDWDNDEIMGEYHRQLEVAEQQELQRRVQETGLANDPELEKRLSDARRGLSPLNSDNYLVRWNPETVQNELTQELEDTKQTSFLNVNIKPETLIRAMRDERLKGLAQLSAEDQAKAMERLSLDPSFYEAQRRATEAALGVDVSQGVIYGTLGSENGHDEFQGGAPMYGELMIRLKPEVKNRTTFTAGDSMTSFGLTRGVRQMLAERGLTASNHGAFAAARQIAPEHADVAKAILNWELQQAERLGDTADREMSYVEAHIRGEISPKDIESIGVPAENDRKMKFIESGKAIALHRSDYVFAEMQAKALREIYSIAEASDQWQGKIKVLTPKES